MYYLPNNRGQSPEEPCSKAVESTLPGAIHGALFSESDLSPCDDAVHAIVVDGVHILVYIYPSGVAGGWPLWPPTSHSYRLPVSQEHQQQQ